ncbi:MAG: hypothetical protein KY476_01575 [Planctomycetes bacterium]|nr:hypothetical protein [Planctomycetota bacterium]
MRRMLLAVLAGAALMFSGCGDSHDKLTADMLDAIRDMNGVLENVKDPASAEAAADDLAAIRDRMDAIKEREEKLGRPSPEQSKAVMEKYKEPISKEMGALMAHMMRIAQNPAIMEKLKGSLDKPGSPFPMFQ